MPFQGGETLDAEKHALLRKLPGVDYVIDLWEKSPPSENIPRPVVVQSIRAALDALRQQILGSTEPVDTTLFSDEVLLRLTRAQVEKRLAFNLTRVVNATGVSVALHVARMSSRYSNLEFDLEKGARGSRYSVVEDILCEISGAEAALVVNNNAGAVFLALETLAKGKAVIVSRGELVEIGGSFRIPDVMARSGARLVEVGTTNRTHPADYENAISTDTALLLKVHTSNYSIVGFTSDVSLSEMVALGAKFHLPVMKDLGSGSFVDFSKYGLIKEPTVQETVHAGVDVVTFSGDKMLGGPQAGIIVGKKQFVDPIKKNPLNRALRIDKMTLAALEATLRLYRDEARALSEVPTLRMLTMPIKTILTKARRLQNRLKKLGNARVQVDLLNGSSRVGGGSLPLQQLPTKCLGIRIEGLSANRLEALLRKASPPVIARIEEDVVVLDLRTVLEDEIAVIADTFKKILAES
ncbi:MAG: L-seryl-tRNA(Sec) selenium transferase [Deltaproteobacteria bacterium]|nr:L-seryl-tRNA(Sec) selenium transferase [Deltaproteobacteria bacterium]